MYIFDHQFSFFRMHSQGRNCWLIGRAVNCFPQQLYHFQFHLCLSALQVPSHLLPLCTAPHMEVQAPSVLWPVEYGVQGATGISTLVVWFALPLTLAGSTWSLCLGTPCLCPFTILYNIHFMLWVLQSRPYFFGTQRFSPKKPKFLMKNFYF